MLSSMLFLLAFSACGSDDDDDDDVLSSDEEEVVSTSPEDNLADEAKAFVGYWQNQRTRGYDWLFLGDGVCKAHLYSKDPGEAGTVGYWTYNTDTGILATTIDGWQWTITLSNSEVWTGISLTNEYNCYYENYTTHYTDGNYPYFKEFVVRTSWANASDSTLTMTYLEDYDLSSVTSISGYAIGGTDDIENYYDIISFSSDDDYTDYTFDYKLYKKSSPYSKGYGTVTLSNPTSSTSAVLTFTGTLTGSYTITSF